MYEQHQGVELKPLPTAKFSSIRGIVSTYQSLFQRTTRRRNVKSQNQWLWRGRRAISLDVSNSSVISTSLVICREWNLDHLRGTDQQRQLPRNLLPSLLWLFMVHSYSISSERCVSMTLRVKFFSTDILAMFIVLRFSHAHLIKKRVCLGQGNSAFPCMRYRPRTKTIFS